VRDQANRDRSVASSVVQFTGGLAFRLETAIQKFDKGDLTAALKDEFVFLSEHRYYEADYFLGCIFEDGTNGCPKIVDKALSHYEKALTELGYVEAYLAVAKLLLLRDRTPQDAVRAAALYSELYEIKQHPVASLRLGWLHETGRGVRSDRSRARELYRHSAARGYVFGYLFLAAIEFKEGRYLAWAKLRAISIARAIQLSIAGKPDARLRSW